MNTSPDPRTRGKRGSRASLAMYSSWVSFGLSRHSTPSQDLADPAPLAKLAYFTRLQTVVEGSPVEAAGLDTVSSSPLMTKARFCDVPAKFGNVDPSIWSEYDLSSALYVPK
jgi:hypothetical protein